MRNIKVGDKISFRGITGVVTYVSATKLQVCVGGPLDLMTPSPYEVTVL